MLGSPVDGLYLLPKFGTLRFRFAWSHGLLVFAVLICWGTVRYQLLSWRSHRALERELEEGARLVLSQLRLESGGIVWDRENLRPDARVTFETLRQRCVVTDGKGDMSSPQEHAQLAMALVETGRLSEVLRSRGGFTGASLGNTQSFRFVTVPVPGTGTDAPLFLHLGSSLDEVEAVLQEYRSFYLRSLPVILLVSGGFIWFLAGRILRPFEQVVQSMEGVTLSSLQTQVRMDRSGEEVQRLVDAFNAMVRRLNESVSQMRRFNANAAHELRTPLAILQGETELALRSPGLPDGTRALLASNLEELGRLSRIVNDLLSLADADGGAQVLAQVPVALKPLLEDLAEQMETLAAEQNLRLRIDRVPDVTVEGDELWLRRAFLNLLDNAVKYSRVEGEILLSSSLEGSTVHVSIADNGIGIAPSDLPYIFERLYRADPARTRASGGAGLGLSLVKWVVESHGGSVTVHSEPGKGSTFVVVLPVSDRQAGSSPSAGQS
jgi:heavy metal sensor kinase